MNGTGQAGVLVGVSGSLASASALRWAAAEARRRHARLRVIRSWDPEFDTAALPPDLRMAPARLQAAAAQSLAEVMCAVFGAEAPDDVTAELARGVAERVLADRSAGAELLVLGSAAPPGGAARSIGPVVRSCLSRASCPVVVVSPPAERDQPSALVPPAQAG
jgi:nucleotide-binding universal stress UspA family protein